MKCNSKIFICYRNNNVDVVEKLYQYIETRNTEENLNIEKIWFSNGEVECNYLYDALEGLKTYDHIIFIIDQNFTKGFMCDDGVTPNENCITAKEILTISQRLTDEFKTKSYQALLPHMYCINVGEGKAGTFSDNGDDLIHYLSYYKIDIKVINLFLKLGENHIVKNDFSDDDFSMVFERVLDKIIKNINVSMNLKRYLSFYKNKQVYKTLPQSKLINCIYAKGEYSNLEKTNKIKDLIQDFKMLFIDKKVYKYHYNDDISDRVYNFKKSILKEDSILIGNAGCGKSTLLFHSYIELVEEIEKEKCIPIFIDLNMVTVSLSLLECIEKVARFFISEKFDLVSIFNELYLQGYKCVLLLDSLDECMVDNIQSQLVGLRQSDLFLNHTKMPYKICVGLRLGRFDSLDADVKNHFRKFSVRNFDKSDVDVYIEKLVSLNRISTSQLASIGVAVELLTYTDKINPFLLSMIIQPYVNDQNYMPNSFKMIDLLYTSVTSLTKKVNTRSREAINKDVDPRSLKIIGVNGVLANVNSLGNPYPFFNVDYTFSEQNFLKDVQFISKNTYLINAEGAFYQKIFSDFFSAKYIYENIGRMNINREQYYKICKYFYNSFNFKEIFEFIILLADKDTELSLGTIDFLSEKINLIIDAMMEQMKEEEVFYYIKAMLSIIKRYSSPKIIRDALPIHLSATYHPDEISIYLFEKYFLYLCNRNCINYGYFYNIISSIDRYDLVLTALLNISDQIDEFQAFKMLSIYRDSYLILKYNGQAEIINCIYSSYFDRGQMAKIYKLATNQRMYQKVSNMPLRETLNAAFYANAVLFGGVEHIPFSKLNPNIDLGYDYFPKIFNIELFVTDSILNSNKVVKIVDETDDLFFNSDQDDFSIDLVNIDSLDSIYELKENVISLFLYQTNSTILPNQISKRGNLLSLYIGEGIEEIKANAFMKSESLRNVVLPKGIKRIGDFAFCHCDCLEELYLPEGITEIGESLIEDCTLLKKIILPKSLKKLGNYLFEQCSSLETVDFQNNPIELPEGIFVGCHSMKSIEELHLSKTTINLPMLCFAENDVLRYADFEAYHLKEINNYCFYKCIALEEIIFPKSLNQIGMCLFYNCYSLKRVVFHSLPIVSSQVFAGLSHPIEIILCDKSYVISSNSEFTEIIFSLGGKVIDDRFESGFAFERKNDGTYNLGYSFNREKKENSLFDMRSFAEKGICISSFTIGAMGDHNFINDVILDENLIEPADWLFEDCQALYNVKLAKCKITKLSKHMFENCDALTEVTLPSTITRIEEYAFENCTNLSTLHFVRNCFEDCKYKKSPSDVALCLEIENEARLHCKFNKNGSIYIPCNVEYIGDYAFHKCYSIQTIYYNPKTTQVSPLAAYETECKFIPLNSDNEIFE
ncbi:MAG: leucine-rich repeat protein [Roseburia sp.]|nr:leucine-rich repeat protein [Anaeroplasma bactoclasticum]MCM1196786.1 leucine-rich repeat protein [Roseburia sp.]MCM1557196.1 leucine-rich repeat protein [Anaeroplasma bactoclasticum]